MVETTIIVTTTVQFLIDVVEIPHRVLKQIKNLVNPSASWQDYAVTVRGNHMSTGEHVEFRKGVKITRLV